MLYNCKGTIYIEVIGKSNPWSWAGPSMCTHVMSVTKKQVYLIPII